MSNNFCGRGNIGMAPVLRYPEKNGEQLTVAELRVYFDRYLPDGDEFKEEGGFWLTVSVWGKRAEQVAKLLKKGSRVYVEGQLRREEWEDENEEVRAELRLTADYVAIDMTRVEAIEWRERDKPE